MRLAVAIQYRSFGICAHPGCSNFMNDDSSILNSVRMGRIDLRSREVGSASGLDDGAHGFLHVFRHLDFVVPPLPVEAQDWDAPLIDYIEIKIARTVRRRKHFATPSEAEHGAIVV